MPLHLEDLQLIEWSCREEAQRARNDAKRETTPSVAERFHAHPREAALVSS